MRSASMAGAALLLVLTVGCRSSEPELRIDPSTPETTGASIDAIQKSLPDAKREQFSQALGVVIPHAMGGGYRDVGDSEEARERVRAALRNKTADEIIADAAKIQASAPKQ